VESIVHRCLEPDPARRYQTARQLHEDLERQLAHRPLRYAPNPSWRERAAKWARRHPRLTSAAGVAAVSVTLLGAAAAVSAAGVAHYQQLRAGEAHRQLQASLPGLRFQLYTRHLDRPRIDAGVAAGLHELEPYGVLTDPAWQTRAAVRSLPEDQRQELREEVGEVLFLLARSTLTEAGWSPDAPDRGEKLARAGRYLDLAEETAGDRFPRSLADERARLGGLGSGDLAPRADAGLPPETARDCYLLGHRLLQANRWVEALPLLEQATRLAPGDFTAWMIRGNCHEEMGQLEEALTCFTACLALREDLAEAWNNRGEVYLRKGKLSAARADFDAALRLNPDFAEARLHRARARQGQRDLAGAIEDTTRAIDLGIHPTRSYVRRAELRRQAKDAAGAERDRQDALRSKPTDALDWLARAEARLEGDPAGALADVEEALKLEPDCVDALQEKAHILGERLHRADEALKALDRAVELLPYHVPTRAGRAVELARRGKRAAALEDARVALMCSDSAMNHYQVGCAYALTAKTNPGDRAEAVRLLWSGMRRGFGVDIADTDTDLDPIRETPEFRKMMAAARALQAAVPR
jgi:tetratricopeptide (TPR) repeat protein